MQIHVARLPRPGAEQSLDVPDGASVLDVLRTLDTPPDAVIVLRDGAPLPVDEPVAEGDHLRVVNVYSGG